MLIDIQIEMEARFGLGGVLASLPARWCNHPGASADTAYKPRQLTDLRAAGLDVPDTLLTNSPDAVLRFAAEHDRIICKPIATGVLQTTDGPHAVYTRLLEPSDLSDLTGVDFTAHLFQEYVFPKEFEVPQYGDRTDLPGRQDRRPFGAGHG